MNASHKFLAFMIMAALITVTACSSSDTMPFFQNNTGNTDTSTGGGSNPFNGLPNNIESTTLENPASLLAEVFNPGTFNLDTVESGYQLFADRMIGLKNGHPEEARDVLTRMAELENTPQAYTMMRTLANILGYVIYQDNYDTEPSGAYWQDLASYLDRINAANTGMKNDLLGILNKSISFMLDPLNPYAGSMEQAMADLHTTLTDTGDPQVKDLLLDLEAGMGRLLVRSNDYIVYNGKNTYLGNAVQGVDLALDGVSHMVSADTEVRNSLYGIIRESGAMLRGSAGGNDFPTIIKQLLTNIEDYNTQGGSQMNSDYYNVDTWPYVNAELRNGVRELWPNIVKLLIRNDQAAHGGSVDDFSIFENANGYSPLEALAVNLDRLKNDGIDYTDPAYAIEDTLKKMSQIDKSGRARGTESDLSILDHLLFTVANSYYFGYLTWKDGGGDSDFDNEPEANYNRRHGKATGGVLTINDSLYAMTTGDPMGYNAYSLALDNRVGQGDNISRSSEYFTSADRANYKFYFGYDYPAMHLLPTACAGDAGIPNGGGPAVTVTTATTDENAGGGTNDYRTYWPQVADGKGILNTAHFLMTWIARTCWDGQGPYYATAGAATTTITAPANNDSGAGATATANSLTDGTKSWVPNEHAGRFIFIGDFATANAIQIHGNTATTLYFTFEGNTDTGAGKSYIINKYNNILHHAGDSAQVYYKPNGETYCMVWKPDSVVNNWIYYYPASGNDVDDAGRVTANPQAGQRANRYADTFRSDYFLSHNPRIESGTADTVSAILLTDSAVNWTGPYVGKFVSIEGGPELLITANTLTTLTFVGNANIGNGKPYIINSHGNKFGAPPMNPNGSALVEGTMGADKYKLKESTSFQPNYFQFYEKIKENGVVDANPAVPIRECATQEEAMYRNLQWLLLEKKFVFTIPMYFVPLGMETFAYIVIEGNGVVGLTNARKGSQNGYWTSGGIGEGNMSTPNLPNYGDSDKLGDARILVFNKCIGVKFGMITVGIDPDIVFGGGGPAFLPATLGPGNAVPGVIGKNIDPFVQLGFLGYDSSGAKKWCMVGSGDRTAAWSDSWANKNRIFPLLLALTSTLYDGTKYVPAGSGYNYNYGGSHKYPIADMLEGVMIPLSKPHMRLYTTSKGYRWVPRVKAGGDYTFFGAMRADSAYIPNDSLRSLLSFLTGNSISSADGLMPVLADTKMTTKLLSLLTRAGNPSNAADRQKMFQGLEQIVTAVQATEGAGLYPTSSYLSYANYGWIFPPLRDGSAGNPLSLNLDTALDDAIGGDSINKGLATFIDRRGGGWVSANDNYKKLITMMGTMMGDTGSPYYITEDVISVLDAFLTKTTTTSTDLKALRHTLGALFARYNGSAWGTDNQLQKLLTEQLPAVMAALAPLDADPPDHVNNLMVVLKNFLDENGDGTVETDNIDYIADLLNLGDTPREAIVSTYQLVSRQAMWDSAYYSPGFPGHATLQELADILIDLAARI